MNIATSTGSGKTTMIAGIRWASLQCTLNQPVFFATNKTTELPMPPHQSFLQFDCFSLILLLIYDLQIYRCDNLSIQTHTPRDTHWKCNWKVSLALNCPVLTWALQSFWTFSKGRIMLQRVKWWGRSYTGLLGVGRKWGEGIKKKLKLWWTSYAQCCLQHLEIKKQTDWWRIPKVSASEILLRKFLKFLFGNRWIWNFKNLNEIWIGENFRSISENWWRHSREKATCGFDSETDMISSLIYYGE